MMSSWIWPPLQESQASLVAQMVTNLPAMQETRLQSLGQDDPLKMGITTHSSILVERILWTEEPGGLQSRGHKESDTTEQQDRNNLSGENCGGRYCLEIFIWRKAKFCT